MWTRAIGLVCIALGAGIVMTGNAAALTSLAGASTGLSGLDSLPEPWTMALLGIGLALVARQLRKRRDNAT